MIRNATRISKQEFEKAITESDGTYIDIAARLGIDRGTLRCYRRRRAYIQDLCDQKRAEMNLPIRYGFNPDAFKRALASTDGNLVRAAELLNRTAKGIYHHMRKDPDLRQWRNTAYPPRNRPGTH